MKDRYLEVTFRKGRLVAAYLYLPRESGAKSARTSPMGPGLLVDFDGTGKAIGIEITAPAQVSVEQINAILGQLSIEPIAPEELAPLRAA